MLWLSLCTCLIRAICLCQLLLHPLSPEPSGFKMFRHMLQTDCRTPSRVRAITSLCAVPTGSACLHHAVGLLRLDAGLAVLQGARRDV